LDFNNKILGLTPVSVPTWAVFTAQEGSDQEIWTEPIQVWAHVRRDLSREDKEAEDILGNEAPRPINRVEGMVVEDCSKELVLASECLDWLLLGLSDKTNPFPADWLGQ